MTVLVLSLPLVGATQQSPATNDAVNAANAFLSSLSARQRQDVVYAFNDAGQRTRWSNFPTGFVPRAGISLKQMSQPQRDAAMKLLATVLSPMGLAKVNEIRAADDDFEVNGSKRGPPRGRGPPPGAPPPGGQDGPFPPMGAPAGSGRAQGKPLLPGDMFGGDLYYISFLGTPSTTSPWMLQFGGHHLALNITIAGDKGVLTPTLTGAQPAAFKVNGKTIRPLGRESDKALALLQSLDAKQRRQAVLNYRVADLVLGPGQDDKRITPEGLKASSLNAAQQAALLDLASEWVGIMTESSAITRMAQIRADLSETWFAWSGSTSGEVGSNITAYYRIQGPHLVIEYAPQQDEPANHVHTIYRDPTNDYGRALTSK
jgi:hypothetical protein